MRLNFNDPLRMELSSTSSRNCLEKFELKKKQKKQRREFLAKFVFVLKLESEVAKENKKTQKKRKKLLKASKNH